MVLELQIQGVSLEHLYFGHWNSPPASGQVFVIWNLNMVKIVRHMFPNE